MFALFLILCLGIAFCFVILIHKTDNKKQSNENQSIKKLINIPKIGKFIGYYLFLNIIFCIICRFFSIPENLITPISTSILIAILIYLDFVILPNLPRTKGKRKILSCGKYIDYDAYVKCICYCLIFAATNVIFCIFLSLFKDIPCLSLLWELLGVNCMSSSLLGILMIINCIFYEIFDLMSKEFKKCIKKHNHTKKK